jgi:hypothetical protein
MSIKHLVAFCAFMVSGLFAGRSSACEMILLRKGLPREGVILSVGSVIGYGTVAHPIATVETAPSLLVRVDALVSGGIKLGETEIVPLFFGPDCQSTPTARQVLETSFPIGTNIAFFRATGSRADAPPTGSIIIESNRGDFVFVMPGDVKRTSDGDLDFDFFEKQHGYSPYSWTLGEFEFARSVIGLRRARQSEKFERLLNLAHYPGFRERQGREWLEELISESRLTTSQRKAVLTASGAP